MKNVSKNKFLTCFRPVVDIDDMLDSEAITDHCSSTCKHITDKHETTISSTKSKFLNQKCSKLTQNDQVVSQPTKNTLAKVVKVVVFETILNIRAHKKNRYNSQNCFGSKRSYCAQTESSSKRGDEKSTARLASCNTNIKEIKVHELGRSSSSSSSLGSERGQFEKQKCLGIYAVLISLLVTVLWGKINVIIFISTLFCCFSLWNASYRRVKRVAELSNRGRIQSPKE